MGNLTKGSGSNSPSPALGQRSCSKGTTGVATAQRGVIGIAPPTLSTPAIANCMATDILDALPIQVAWQWYVKSVQTTADLATPFLLEPNRRELMSAPSIPDPGRVTL